MSQINLDTSPYFDDFDAKKDFYKVLFKPGFPVQARELTTLQSILQNQISKFGEHFFKEGSMVIPGAITYNPNYFAVILNNQQGGIDVSLYLDKLIGVTIRGETSGVKAKVVNYVLPPDEGVTSPTIFVSYTDSGTDEETSTFLANEALVNEAPITYGNTTLTSGSIFASTVSIDATAVGSAAQIGEGVYFLRGTFVQVQESTLILQPYVNVPSFRVGLQINESIVTSGQDSSLYDNAKGFNNFSAPGADRLKITATLTKKPLNDFNDTNFVELLKVQAGEIKKLEEASDYNIFKDYFAQRTYDESGDYVVDGLGVSIDNSLSDGLGNGGIYTKLQKTDEGSDPSDDLAIVKISSGKAYVRGYDLKNPGTVNLDSPKTRTTETIESTAIPFEMGSRYIVNNVTGAPAIGLNKANNVVELYDGRLSGTTPTGNKIGEARPYAFSLEDAPYSGNDTPWDLFLYDVQIYTRITLNISGAGKLEVGQRVRGLSSNSIGYIAEVSGTEISLTQVTGDFQRRESLQINNSVAESFSISSVIRGNLADVRSVFQDVSSVSGSGLTTDFSADTRLYLYVYNNFAASDLHTISGSTMTCAGRFFDSYKVNDIISYQKEGDPLVTFNRVAAISDDERQITLAAITSVADVCDGALSGPTISVPVRGTNARILNQERAYLYSKMEKDAIASVDLDGSSFLFSKQVLNVSSDAIGTLVINSTDLGVDGASYAAFDQERYSIIYSNGDVETLNASQVAVTGDTVIFRVIRPLETGITVNVTGIKQEIRSKTKIVSRSEEILVDKISVGVGTATFGMENSNSYGLRVDDDQISLNVPDAKKVVAIYESLNTGAPTLDTLSFVNGLELDSNAIKGEFIRGQVTDAVALVVSTPTSSTVRVVYQSQDKFEVGELVVFEESNIRTNLQLITPGNFKDVTNNYVLDKGQREQFYDYSRIVRKDGYKPANKKLLVVFDRFIVPANDNGDFYTANSFDDKSYSQETPVLRNNTIRLADVLDFRPRVADYNNPNQSPFFFGARNFDAAGSTVSLVTTPNESITLGYSHYVGRKDRIILDPDGKFKILLGSPADEPALPSASDSSLELARIEYPPYLFDPDDAKIIEIDNRRYTMRDIGKLEDRIESLEEITSLSLLERQTESLQVIDSQGNDRFKTGFFADDFSNASLIDYSNPDTTVEVATGVAVPFTEFATLPLRLQLRQGIDDSSLDLSIDLPLLDENTTKTGDLVTLNYGETEWIKQPLASRIENVNPFNVILYTGRLSLSPRNDDFIVTRNIGNNRIDVFGDASSTSTTTFVEGIEVAQFMRERNVAFQAASLRPYTRFYPFFDGSSGIDVIPKLLEISMRSGSFLIGETIEGFNGETRIFRARVAAPNHKTGNFALPARTYVNNPYRRDVVIASSYSASSIILNLDVDSLADIADERFFGLVALGTRIVGESSGAIADLTDIKLVTDAFGEVGGCFFFRDPYTEPAPAFRLRTGIRTFRLSSSPTNAVPVLGATTVSFAETLFESGGTVQNRLTQTINIRNLPPPPPPVIIDRTVTNNFTDVIDNTVTEFIDRTVTVENVIDRTVTNNLTEVIDNTVTEIIDNTVTIDNTQTIVNNEVIDRTVTIDNTVTNNITRVERQVIERVIDRTRTVQVFYDDPLSQTFRVDETGAFLTSVDIFMSTKATTDNLFVQIRPTELGTPVDFLLQDYAEVVLSPDQVNVSDDGSVATNVVFPSPIYLEPEVTYALVLVAPTTNEYTAWVARMGEANISSGASEATGDVIISQQYLNGSLFKSQNGSIWTPSQFEDLKFTLYKASFVTDTPSTVYLSNPRLGRQTRLVSNPITTLPRKIRVPVSGSDTLDIGAEIASVSTGSTNEVKVQSTVEFVGGPSASATVTDGGVGFADGTYNGANVYKIDSDGESATLNVTVSGGEITNVTVASGGTGYKVGDTVGIVTSEVGGSGGDATITIGSIGQTDTLYLTNVLGEKMQATDLIDLYDPTTNTLQPTNIVVQSESTVEDPMYDGNVFILDLPNHGMHSDQNLIDIVGVLPDTIGVPTLEEVDLTSNLITFADSSEFDTFEGISTSTGYALIGGEIVEYANNNDGTLSIVERGIDDTLVSIHDQGSRVFKYELSGVSLRRINTQLDLPSNVQLGNTREINKLPLRFDRKNRSTGQDQINFNQEQSAGGISARSSQNIMFNRVFPSVGQLTPGAATNINASMRTVTATSADGTEESFVDRGYIPVTINDFNRFTTPRMVCSFTNETENLDIPRDRSFTIALELTTSDPNLSPVIDVNQLAMVLSRTTLNSPVTNFADDPRINQVSGDPHASIYISTKVDLKNVSTSLRVLLSAYRDDSADIRVLYRLFDAAAEGSTEPTWELFPGYTNLVDTDGDGIGDRVIDPSKNNGLSNAEVKASATGEVLEYEYFADDLPEFSGFQIKIIMAGTNEARAPFFSDIRAIALA